MHSIAMRLPTLPHPSPLLSPPLLSFPPPTPSVLPSATGDLGPRIGGGGCLVRWRLYDDDLWVFKLLAHLLLLLE